MHRSILFAIVMLLAGVSPLRSQSPRPQPRIVDQPVQEYFWPQVPYTHLGTSFGTMGPESVFRWEGGHIRIEETSFAGVWHSLAGRADEPSRTLDFAACFPPVIRPRFQPRVTGVFIACRLRGKCVLEIKSADDRVLWRQAFSAQDTEIRRRSFPVPVDQLRKAKLLSWFVEDASISVDSVGLQVEVPPLSFRTWSFVVDLAKLARCYDTSQALVRDKAFLRPGEFDCIPTTGMFCLASAVAGRLGIADRQQAERILVSSARRVGQVTRHSGLLPHFVAGSDPPAIAARTEYSSVDSSLYFHSMVLAAQLLEQSALLDSLADEMRAIDFSGLRGPSGYLSHGVSFDGQRLPSVWSDWGGESALVMMLESMGSGRVVFPALRHPGRVHQGVGFIAEIQSLFYPHFSKVRPDRFGTSWHAARAELLRRQQSYFAPSYPCRRLGVMGLSAGEGPGGVGYVAQGVDQAGHTLIHPHYLLMSSGVREPPESTYDVLRQLEQRGQFPPWGLVENIQADLKRYLPFHGSLNAAFECLSAYHLAVQTTGRPDLIYQAAESCPLTRRAATVFYPSR